MLIKKFFVQLNTFLYYIDFGAKLSDLKNKICNELQKKNLFGFDIKVCNLPKYINRGVFLDTSE